MTVNINGTVTNVVSQTLYLPFGPAADVTFGNGLKRVLAKPA